MLKDQTLTLEIDVLVGLGILSGILSVIGFVPYIVDTLKKRTQPEGASWLIWSVLCSIAFFSQLYEEATNSLWLGGVQVGGTVLIFLLSIRLGVRTRMSRRNKAIFAIAFAGLVAWYFTETAVYALAITITISLLGGSATVLKAYHQPETETLSLWVLTMLSCICAVLSAGTLDWVILAYPLYLLTISTAIAGAILVGQMRKAAVPVREIAPASFREPGFGERERIGGLQPFANPTLSVALTGITISHDVYAQPFYRGDQAGAQGKSKSTW